MTCTNHKHTTWLLCSLCNDTFSHVHYCTIYVLLHNSINTKDQSVQYSDMRDVDTFVCQSSSESKGIYEFASALLWSQQFPWNKLILVWHFLVMNAGVTDYSFLFKEGTLVVHCPFCLQQWQNKHKQTHHPVVSCNCRGTSESANTVGRWVRWATMAVGPTTKTKVPEKWFPSHVS